MRRQGSEAAVKRMYSLARRVGLVKKPTAGTKMKENRNEN